jgi:hypothetical protein
MAIAIVRAQVGKASGAGLHLRRKAGVPGKFHGLVQSLEARGDRENFRWHDLRHYPVGQTMPSCRWVGANGSVPCGY